MRHFHVAKNKIHSPSINLDKIWSLVSEQTRVKAAAAKAGAPVPVVDVTASV